MERKKTNINIYISFAYYPQEDKKEYKKEDFEATFTTLFEDIERDLSEYSLKITPFFELIDQFGKKIPEGIIKKIKEADLSIVDISVNNPNVMFELGGLTLMDKENFLIKKTINQDGKDIEIPIDIDRDLVYPYTDIQNLVTRRSQNPKFYEDIKERITKILKSNRFYFDRFYTDIWFPENTNRIVIIVPPDDRIKPEDYNSIRLDNFGDKDTLLFVWGLLHKYYTNATFEVYSSENYITNGDNKENMVIIGGPGYAEIENNKWTKKIMNNNRYKSLINLNYCEKLKDKEKEIFMTFMDKKYEPEYEKDQIKKDWGYFARMINPYKVDRRIIMLQGIYTHGGYGAAQAFSDFPNSNLNIKKLIEINTSNELLFQTIFNVEVIEDRAECPEFNCEWFFPLNQ